MLAMRQKGMTLYVPVFRHWQFCSSEKINGNKTSQLLDKRIEKYAGKEYNLSTEGAHKRALKEFEKEYGIVWEEL